MEKAMLATSTRALSHRVGSLGPDELEAYMVITETGPVLELGDVVISADVWSRVPRYYLWFAIDVHQCGYWGRVSDVDYENNERALTSGGSVVSRWTFAKVPAFWVTTDTSSPQNKTSVFIANEEA